MALDLSTSTDNTDAPGATWWECDECGGYAWLPPGESEPECSCDDGDDE